MQRHAVAYTSINAIETCNVSQQGLIEAIETCNVSQQELIETLRTDVTAIETCNVSQQELIHTIETCNVSQQGLINAIETCNVSQQELIDTLRTDVSAIETCNVSQNAAILDNSNKIVSLTTDDIVEGTNKYYADGLVSYGFNIYPTTNGIGIGTNAGGTNTLVVDGDALITSNLTITSSRDPTSQARSNPKASAGLRR